MNVADYLRRQFAYDEWANREVLHAIRTAGGTDQRSLQLMSHILAAERVWLDRLKQQPQSVPVWPQPDLSQCEAQAAEMGKLWLEFLDLITAGDVSQSISYKNSKGEQWTSTIAALDRSAQSNLVWVKQVITWNQNALNAALRTRR